MFSTLCCVVTPVTDIAVSAVLLPAVVTMAVVHCLAELHTMCVPSLHTFIRHAGPACTTMHKLDFQSRTSMLYGNSASSLASLYSDAA